MQVVLGVHNVAYTDPEHPGLTTTGEVAERLEQDYDVMAVFVERHRKEMMADVGKRLAQTVNALFRGRPVMRKGIQLSRTEVEFRQYLSQDEWQTHTGRVIQAARLGRSSRFKKAGAKRPPRPAFIDTGLYQRSFRAWLEP